MGGAVGVLVVGLIAWGEFSRKAVTPADGIKAEKARRKIAELQGRRAELLAQDAIDVAETEEVDAALADNRREIEGVRRRADVPVEDLEAEFCRLGL